jgi:hypothetical protein
MPVRIVPWQWPTHSRTLAGTIDARRQAQQSIDLSATESCIRISSENNEQWIQIADGGDGYNTGWDEEFKPVMEQIEQYIDDIEMYQLEVDWNEICTTVPALRGKDWDISIAAICLSFSSKIPKNNRSFNQWSNS